MRVLVLSFMLLFAAVSVVPSAEAYLPVCIEKSVGTSATGTVEVWVTCYPGVWRCAPGQQMPDCERIDEGILS